MAAMFRTMSAGWEGHPERERLEDRAKRALWKGLELNGADAAAWNALGLLHVEKQRHGFASECFNKVLAGAKNRDGTSKTPRRANLVAAFCNLGISLQLDHKFKASMRMYRKALRLDPSYAQVHN